MDKIEVYITCCKKDFYFARTAVASIRYWNEHIPVFLVKDHSQGKFSTKALEEKFRVGVIHTNFENLIGYNKLYPLVEGTRSRILFSDADIVWLGNLEHKLNDFEQDIVFDGYAPENPLEEMNSWYFNTRRLEQYYPGYLYPGFLFNCGFFLCNSSIFRREDFDAVLEWRDHPSPRIENVFLCEDQGIINYLVAGKILRNEITFSSARLQVWGHCREPGLYDIQDIKSKKDKPVVIHWFGQKTGLVSFQPGARILRFYEKFYFSHFPLGTVNWWAVRVMRTLRHLPRFVYETGKAIFYFFTPKPGIHD